MAINLSLSVYSRQVNVVAEVVDLAINLSGMATSQCSAIVAEVVDLAINLSSSPFKVQARK